MRFNYEHCLMRNMIGEITRRVGLELIVVSPEEMNTIVVCGFIIDIVLENNTFKVTIGKRGKVKELRYSYQFVIDSYEDFMVIIACDIERAINELEQC